MFRAKKKNGGKVSSDLMMVHFLFCHFLRKDTVRDTTMTKCPPLVRGNFPTSPSCPTFIAFIRFFGMGRRVQAHKQCMRAIASRLPTPFRLRVPVGLELIRHPCGSPPHFTGFFPRPTWRAPVINLRVSRLLRGTRCPRGCPGSKVGDIHSRELQR